MTPSLANLVVCVTRREIFFERHCVPTSTNVSIYAIWPLLRSFLSEVLPGSAWQELMDHVFIRPPAFFPLIVVAFIRVSATDHITVWPAESRTTWPQQRDLSVASIAAGSENLRDRRPAPRTTATRVQRGGPSNPQLPTLSAECFRHLAEGSLDIPRGHSTLFGIIYIS